MLSTNPTPVSITYYVNLHIVSRIVLVKVSVTASCSGLKLFIALFIEEYF